MRTGSWSLLMRLRLGKIVGLLALATLSQPAFIPTDSNADPTPEPRCPAPTRCGLPHSAITVPPARRKPRWRGWSVRTPPISSSRQATTATARTTIDVNVGQYFSSYIGSYAGAYGPGSTANRFFPALGNHDFSDGGGLGAYLAYFTLPETGALDTSTSGNERYYDFVRGPVHFFAIDSDANEADGRDSTSTQARWLKARLAASTSPWRVVYFHHAPYSSGLHGSVLAMRWPFEDWGADAVFAGHDHVYERLLADQNKDGKAIPYFTTGAGGRACTTSGRRSRRAWFATAAATER